MLSKFSLGFLRFVIKTASFSHLCPFQWDTRRNRVRLTDSKTNIALFALNMFLLLVYEVYLLWRVAQSFLSTGSTVSEVVRVTYNAALYMLPPVLQFNMIRRWREIPAFVNGYLTFFERFGGLCSVILKLQQEFWLTTNIFC